MTTSVHNQFFCDHSHLQLIFMAMYLQQEIFWQPPHLRPSFVEIPMTPNQLREASQCMQDIHNTVPILFLSKAEITNCIFSPGSYPE